ncbi:MAG: IS110 family transposase, partial [Gammaproteobacteria bacterium]
MNQVRGLLCEYGLVVGQGVHTLRRALPPLLEDAENGLTALGLELFWGLYERLVDLDKRIAEHETKISEGFASHPLCQRLAKVEGIGPLTATAIVAGVADP